MIDAATLDRYRTHLQTRGLNVQAQATTLSAVRRYAASSTRTEPPTRGDVLAWVQAQPRMTVVSQRRLYRSVVAYFAWLANPDPPVPALQKGQKVASLADAYLRERKQRGEICAGTVRSSRWQLYDFAESFGDRPVRNLGRRDIERWLQTMEGLAPATRRGSLSLIKQFCRWLARRGYIRVDPTTDIPPVRLPRYLPRALDGTAAAKVVEHAPDARGRLVVLLMLQEGLRCCEVSRLQLHDISERERVMRVVGKGDHERLLPVSSQTWAAFETYLMEYPAVAGPLVRSYRQEGRALTADTISGMVAGWMNDAGIKNRPRDGVSAHACRHTAATDMLRQGAHIRDVQFALGHVSLETTQRYLPLIVKDLREAMSGRSY